MALGGGDKIGRDANVRSRRLERPRQLSPTAELKGRSFLAIRSCDDDMILDGKLDQLGR